MKNISKQVYKLATLLVLLLFVNCQKEQLTLDELELNNENKSSIVKTVSARDIPEVMNFIASKSSDYKFLLDDSTTEEGMNRSHEDNLVMTELITDQITQVTNSYQKSNYTFNLIKQSGTNGNYFLNLVVKEYKDTFYLYIVKYVPDAFWLNTHSMANDLGDFTGHMYYYSDQGIYVANVTMQNGSSTASSYNPCPDDTDDGIENPDDDGTGGGGGGQDCTLTITWYECTGPNASIPHPPAGTGTPLDCGAPGGSGSGVTITEFCTGNNNYSANNINDLLRNPCGGTGGATGGGTYCQPDPDCVFPMQLNENCDCVEPQEIENNDVVVLIDKDALTIVNNCMDLDFDQTQIVVNNHLETAMANYITENGCSVETEEFLEIAIIEFVEILEEFPDARFERYIELLELIEEDPWVLIQDCAEQNGMDTSNYIDLYNHTIPQECQDRLDGLGSEYNNQSISEGNVPLANIDYYGVEITNYPDFDNDGNPDTETEIFQAFREKFTDLASGEKENFESECNVPFDLDNIIDIWWQFNPMSSYDANLFLSNNPISSILIIDAGANNPFVNTNADLGAIIVSDFTSNNWTISTIQTPSTETQPFSGNRQWGWLINQNGNLEFYTRAIDVARVADIFLERPATWFGSDIECQQDTYYDIAEATWQNLQDEIKEWIENEGGGQANVNSPKVARISKNKILEILTTNESIEQILSSCD